VWSASTPCHVDYTDCIVNALFEILNPSSVLVFIFAASELLLQYVSNSRDTTLDRVLYCNPDKAKNIILGAGGEEVPWNLGLKWAVFTSL
jgi:hypothetical protein